MSEGSKIQWTNDTWNPWRGCHPVSPGCAHCYAELLVERFYGKGAFKKRVRSQEATFNAPLRWNVKPWVCDVCGEAISWNPQKDSRLFSHVEGPCRECGGWVKFHRRCVFSLSLGDWLDEAVPIEWLADALDVIRRCPNLDFQLLTKRPGNFFIRLVGVKEFAFKNGRNDLHHWVFWWIEGTAPANVWIGCTVENQEWADKRIPELLRIPAVCRFVSYEPALGPVDFHYTWTWGKARKKDKTLIQAPRIHWVIVGGESGPKARPFNVEWARSTIEQCKAAGVACFVKQIGSDPFQKPAPLGSIIPHQKDKKGGDISEWPEDLRVREFPAVKS